MTLHDESGRAQQCCWLLNANNGQKSIKLPITKEACRKVVFHETQKTIAVKLLIQNTQYIMKKIRFNIILLLPYVVPSMRALFEHDF